MPFTRPEICRAFWASVAAFGVYFSMYAFRKPFAAAAFSGLSLGGFDFKTVLIISQLGGYLLSKFIGIQIISGLKTARRIQFLVGLLVVAELALLGFAVTPFPYNFGWLFLNGLPLGIVFGVVFSFLEGRRLTELMSLGLGVSIIFASGAVKSVGKIMLDQFQVNQFWMPFLTGLVFVPLLAASLWMLAKIPPPDTVDRAARGARLPMSAADRLVVFLKYWPSLVLLILTYISLTLLRDLRDNFAVEIWAELGFLGNSSVLAMSELVVSILILAVVGSISFVKKNEFAFQLTLMAVVAGGAILGISTYFFEKNTISPMIWMVMSGFGLFLGYTVFQGILFERMIATLRETANVGFLMYLADAFGYLGSAGVLLFKNLGQRQVDWLPFFRSAAYLTAVLTVIFGSGALLYFHQKQKKSPDEI